jgi:hypothetical protein
MKRISSITAGIFALVLASCNSAPTAPIIDYFAPSHSITSQRIEKIKRSPAQLGIYYGWPSLVEGSKGNLAHAADVFNGLEYLVLGTGLELASHRDHYNTKQIIASLESVEVYGYIDLGNDKNTSRFTLDEISFQVDNWKKMGIAGIFYDDAYPAFNVDQERLSQAVNFAKKNKMKTIINSYDIAWAISTGAVGKADEGDSLLIEPFLVSRGKYLSSENFSATKLLVKYYTGMGYAFHGAAHYDENTTEEEKQSLSIEIQKIAKELKLKSVAFTNEFYSGYGKEQNRLVLY